MAKGLSVVEGFDEHDAVLDIAFFDRVEQLTGEVGKILGFIHPILVRKLVHLAGKADKAIDRFFIRQRRVFDLALYFGEYSFEITFRGLEFHYRNPSLRRV